MKRANHESIHLTKHEYTMTNATETQATSNVANDIQAAVARRQAAAEELQRSPHLLSFDYLEQHDLPVFVRNNINVGAMMVIDVKTKNGRTQTLDIQNTDIPYELTQTLTYDELRASPGFMKSLRNQTLKLLDPTTAVEFLSSPSVARRLQKLETSRFSKDSETQAPKSFALHPLVNENVIPGSPSQEATPSSDPINSRLRALVADFEAENMNADDFEDKIADNARTFSVADWTWLAGNIKHDGVRAMAAQQLSVKTA